MWTNQGRLLQSPLSDKLYSEQVNANRACQLWAATSPVLISPAFIQTTSTATGASLLQQDTVSNSSSQWWTWRTVTACQRNATTTLCRFTTAPVRPTPCWGAGVAESNLPLSSQKATSCWWYWTQTGMKPTEGLLHPILEVSSWRGKQVKKKMSFLLHSFMPSKRHIVFFPPTKVVPVNVSCTRSEFTILIPQQSLPQLDRENIYLGNPSCTAQLTATSYKILAQFVNCGTASQVSWCYLILTTF